MSTDEPSLMDLARDERADLAEFLTTLTSDEWQTESLCTGWTVKDVVAHVVSYDELGPAGLLKRFVKGRVVRANEVGVAEYSTMSTAGLVEFLNRHLRPQGSTAGFGGMIGLVDGAVHHQDIRPRTRPPARRARAAAGTDPASGDPATRASVRVAESEDFACAPPISGGSTATGRKSPGPERRFSWR